MKWNFPTLAVHVLVGLTFAWPAESLFAGELHEEELPPAYIELSVTEEPPPSLEVRHTAFYEARKASMAAARKVHQTPKQWLKRYRPTSLAGASVALVRFVSDDGPRPGRHLRASTWAVDTQLSGPPLSERFTLIQVGVDGELGEDGSLIGRLGRLYAVIVEQDRDSDYRLINDGTGAYSFLIPLGDGDYIFPEDGPRISLEELKKIIEDW